MAKSLEEQYIDYLQSILNINQYTLTHLHQYDYRYGNTYFFTHKTIMLQDLSAFDGNGLAEAIDITGRKGYIDLTGTFFTKEELKEAEQSQNYIRFASGAKSSLTGEPLLYLTNFETDMDKACIQYHDKNLIGEDEFDLSGNPENNVPANTHLLPSSKTGMWYVVTKYGSILLKSSQEIAIRGELIFTRPNHQKPYFDYYDMAGNLIFSGGNRKLDVSYAGGYSKKWDQPFHSLFRENNKGQGYYTFSYFSEKEPILGKRIKDGEKDFLNPTKQEQEMSQKYYWDAAKGISDTVEVRRTASFYDYVSAEGEREDPKNNIYQLLDDLNNKTTFISHTIFSSDDWTLTSHLYNVYLKRKSDQTTICITEPLNTAYMKKYTADSGYPILITKEASYYFLDNHILRLNNDLLGVDFEKTPQQEILLIKKDNENVKIIPFDEFTGYEKEEEKEQTLPSLLEQIQQKTDDELKIALAEKLIELSKLLEEIKIYQKTLNNRNVKTPKRTTIHDDQLFIPVGDHLEILPWYIENGLLPVINLSSNTFDNVKVSGIDFTGTNANIDPQKVYQKDMSNGIYDGLNFTMKNFSDVNTDNASFTGCIMDFVKNPPKNDKNLTSTKHLIRRLD